MGSTSKEAYSFKIGTIVGVKGLNGEVKLKLDSDFDLIESVSSITLCLGDTISDAKVRSIKAEGKSVLMRIEGYNSREDTDALMGATIFTQKSQLRALEEDEWWFGDL